MDSTIIAALVGAGIAYLSLIIAKEQKISEFRQHWVDCLRADSAKMISGLVHLQGYLEKKAKGELVELDEVFPILAEANVYLNSAHMRLNASEPLSASLLETIEKIEEYYTSKAVDIDELKVLIDKLRPQTKLVLKSEWERVKKGERTFIIAKRTTLFLALVALSSFIFLYIFGLPVAL